SRSWRPTINSSSTARPRWRGSRSRWSRRPRSSRAAADSQWTIRRSPRSGGAPPTSSGRPRARASGAPSWGRGRSPDPAATRCVGWSAGRGMLRREGRMSDQASEMMAKIDRGVRLEAAAEMTGEYRDNLIHLLTMQADSELAGGYGYVPWITKAPTVEEKHVVAQIVKDELRHATVMYGLLADLGVDVDSHVRQHDEIFTMRIDAGRDIGTARITSDKRVNIFYYPIDTWADFIFFNFCMDRGAGHQLEDVRGCSYGPWVRAIDGIFKEEKFHIRHGEYWVKKLAEDTTTHAEAQTTFDKWYIRTMNIFGRPGSPKNQVYRRLKLKLRDNDEVRRAFAVEVKDLCEKFGLTVPEWKPVWDKLPEEAHIPGTYALLS